MALPISAFGIPISFRDPQVFTWLAVMEGLVKSLFGQDKEILKFEALLSGNIMEFWIPN